MNNRPTTLLYALNDVGLILPWPSGVLYQQQTGGYSCLQNRIEGVFVPIDDSNEHFEKLERLFTGPKWGGHCARGIDTETADFIDATLATVPSHSTIKVDRARLGDSHEAWVHVLVGDPASTGLLEGFPPGPAILTWPNSD